MNDQTAQTGTAADHAPRRADGGRVAVARTPVSGGRDARREPTEADARDLSLVHAYRAGDEGALAELLESYQDRLFGVCVRMVNDPDVASDMVQESMVKIIHGLPQFSGRSKLSTWMIRVTMNVCLTWRRKQRLRRHASLDAPFGDGEGGAATMGSRLEDEAEPGAPGRVEQREARRRLTSAMEQLEPQQRAILILRDMQDFDYAQIAAILSVPEGTVKSRLFRARAALREAVERLERRRPDESSS